MIKRIKINESVVTHKSLKKFIADLEDIGFRKYVSNGYDHYMLTDAIPAYIFGDEDSSCLLISNGGEPFNIGCTICFDKNDNVITDDWSDEAWYIAYRKNFNATNFVSIINALETITNLIETNSNSSSIIRVLDRNDFEEVITEYYA